MQIQSKTQTIGALLVLALLAFSNCISQTVGQFKYQNQVYNVYPYRVSDDDIPVIGLNIPDGKYIVFDNYTFNRKRTLRRKRKYVLNDTAVVKAILNIKKNLPEGPATFYYYRKKNNWKFSKNPYSTSEGTFVNGLKSGRWELRYTKDLYREVTHYKEGRLEGYCYNYNERGELKGKSKYCNGTRCDTVFSYENGKLHEEYDFCPSYLLDKQETIYSEALKKSGHYVSLDVKSFYKRYNLSTGALEMDLKFKNGAVQTFDSMGYDWYNTLRKQNYYRYAVIKPLGENKRILISARTSFEIDEFSKSYYHNDFKYLYIEDKIERVYERRFLRSDKWVRTDTSHLENYFLNPDSINMESLKPVLIEQSIWNKRTTSYFYIPKYHFVYSSKNSPELMRIDTTNKALYFKHMEYDRNTILKKKYIVKYATEADNKMEEAKINPYLLKDYIMVNKVETHGKYMQRYDGPSTPIYYDKYNMAELSYTYSVHDTLLNGKWCFTNCTKIENPDPDQRYFRYSKFEPDIRTGTFVDGKKQGFWKELGYSPSPKRIPDNLKDWFFKHPKSAVYYYEKNYVNGFRDGLCVYYDEETSYADRKRNGRGRGKAIHTLYKDREMIFTRDTVNGIYKDYHSNGALKTEANFIMGRPDGDYKTYFSDKTPSALIQFKYGKLHGKYIRWDDGGIKCYANFKDNVLTDSLIFYQAKGKPLTCIYTDNERLKRKTMYFHDGKLKEEVNFYDTSAYLFYKETISPDAFLNSIKRRENTTFARTSAAYKNYYENGQLLSEGHIHNGEMAGTWKFYSLNGVLLHEVYFKDSIIHLPNRSNETNISGTYKGYYSNGEVRAIGYLKDVEISFDCFTKQDKADFDFYILDFYNNAGLQTIKNGNGVFIKYDPNGLILASGKLVNCMPDSLWRFYTPEQKLTETGFFVNEKKDGIWYEGDLEGVNFEDGACFDLTDPGEVKMYEKKRRTLDITRYIYRNGEKTSIKSFKSNLNKTYQPARHYR